MYNIRNIEIKGFKMFHKDKREKPKKKKRMFWFKDYTLFGTKRWSRQFGNVKKSRD